MKKIIACQCIFWATFFIKSANPIGLNEFVTEKLANYTTWVRSNNLDPSNLVSGPTHFHQERNGVILDCDLRNHGVRGHSEQIVIQTVDADLGKREFIVTFNTSENVTFFGHYSANVTFPTGNVQSEGVWQIHIPVVRMSDFKIKFDLSSETLLHLTGHYLKEIAFYKIHDGNVYFENILEEKAVQGHEYDFTCAFRRGLYLYLHGDRYTDEHPLRTMFLNFWKDVFATTKLTDIIGKPENNVATTSSNNLFIKADLVSSTSKKPVCLTATNMTLSAYADIIEGKLSNLCQEDTESGENPKPSDTFGIAVTKSQNEYAEMNPGSPAAAEITKRNVGILLFIAILTYLSMYIL